MRLKPVKVGLYCLGILTVVVGCSAEKQAAVVNKQPVVQVMELPAPVDHKLHKFNGVLQSDTQANLSFRVQGVLEQMVAKVGSKVKKGQVIARLDPHDFQVSVLELTAKLEEAKAAHRLAVIELDRVKVATSERAIASVQLDRAIAAQARSKAGVELVRQSLKKAQDALRYTELTAPYDGVVGQTFVEQHELVNAGMPIVTIHQPELLNAIIDVPESQIWNFKKGIEGQISWFNNTEKVSAVVTKISTVPSRFKRTYEVTFRLQHTPKQLVSGKAVSVDVALNYDANKSVFCIPAQALVSNQSQLYVNKLQNNIYVQAVAVNAESQTEKSVCVSGGLAKGDQVIIAGSAFVEEGQKVSIAGRGAI